jgi:predicted GNAT family acetyltransferase
MNAPRISTASDDQDVGLIHAFLANESAWAPGIPIELVRESIKNSLNFGVFIGDAQVAYARVVTDCATFAYLVDVFVVTAHRCKGHSTLLMTAVMNDVRLQRLRRFMLATSTAHGLYEKFGFAAPVKPDTLMERFVADAYRSRVDN